MTKEQEEAIERLQNRTKEAEDYKTTQVFLTTDIRAIKTVLSMLEEKDKQIADLEKTVEQIYEDYQDIGKMAFDYSDRIELLEKQIDLMAEYIDFDKMNFECSSLCVKDNCQKDCIKQYFENKAKEYLKERGN